MKKTRLVILPALGALCLLTSGCAKEKEKETEPVLPVELAALEKGPIQRIITADGILRALDQSAVVPKISAPVRKFYVNRGDAVKAGQLLATLESRDLAATVTEAKGSYEQAAANYRNVASATVPDEVVKAEADLQAARQTAEAAKKLLDSREQLYRDGALARRMVDEAAVAYAQAKGQYDTALKHLESVQKVSRLEEVKSAEAQMESAKGKHEAAQAQLSYSEVRSPISGVIADRALFPGEMAAAGTPLLTVMDISSVIARTNIPQSQATFVRIGQEARVASTDGIVATKGRVTVVSPAMDPQSTTVEIWVQAPNPEQRLRPGGTVRVTILADTIRDALLAPKEALLPSQEGGTALMVVDKDSVVHEQKAEVGVRGEEKVQILSGAKEGDRVVVSGGVGLADGSKVKVAKKGGEHE